MFDDSKLLVRHIRNCFIQGDESGHCEQALDDLSKHRHSPPIPPPDADDLKECFADRFSSNKAGTSTKVYYLTALQDLSMSEFYPDNQCILESVPEPDCTTNSIIGDILTSHYSNPFHHYSRFSGKITGFTSPVAICPGVRNLSISLFLTSRAPVEGGPLSVFVNVSSARIVDLIGLVLYQYFSEMREPFLHDFDVSHYALLSTDDGEVDFGIPSFDPLEPLSKYGFSNMALVHVPVVLSKELNERHGIGSPRLGTYNFLLDSKDVTLSKLIEMYISKVSENLGVFLDKSHFTLEAESEPGKLCENLDNQTIGRTGSKTFIVHRKYCNPAPDDKIDTGKSGSNAVARNSAENGKIRGQVFQVALTRTKNKPVDVELVVDTDVVYLNQKEPGTSKSTPKSIVRATIDSCKLIGADVGAVPGSRQVVRVQLTYKPSDNTSKNMILEMSDQVTAVELVSLLRR